MVAPVAAILASSFASAVLARAAVLGRWSVLRSPLTGLGAAAVMLAVVQVAPLPPALAAKLSPRSRAVYSQGVLPDRALADDPAVELPEGSLVALAGEPRPPGDAPLAGRPPRAAWACSGAWPTSPTGSAARPWSGGRSSRPSRRTRRSPWSRSPEARPGSSASIEPGPGRPWVPSRAILLTTPNATALRALPEAAPRPRRVGGRPARPPRTLGTLPGGAGAYLALASLGLPLALGLALHWIAPAGQPRAAWPRGWRRPTGGRRWP